MKVLLQEVKLEILDKSKFEQQQRVKKTPVGFIRQSQFQCNEESPFFKRWTPMYKLNTRDRGYKRRNKAAVLRKSFNDEGEQSTLLFGRFGQKATSKI